MTTLIILSNVTTIIINLYTLYTIRKMFVDVFKKAKDGVEEIVHKI
jgi:hypothetical protein